ncbi:CHAD domain-containing protein [Campylobacter sp. RM15925]|uniref:CYTH and CHAD domain-containing protein n=1 Tax=Campylobacter sp. RM15925 TaxID=1705724 RepID=UPI001474D500|nr:CHAD domain-containing protein [Campylobacter sp. RM15925]
MVLEIERKFILDGISAIQTLEKDGILATSNEIIQFYTKITQLEEIRFRKSGDKFTVTQKIGRGLVRKESEIPSDKKSYKDALKEIVGMPIKKTRFEFKINNLPCNIDIYHEFLEGLATLEIEFLTVNDAQNFAIPEFLARYITSEITEDERYKNKSLALFGVPEIKFDIQSTLKIIDQNHDLKLAFPSSLRSFDAARVMFFQIYKQIRKYRQIYLETKDEEALHQFRVNLRKTRSMLKLLSSVFDKKTADHFNKNFKTIASSTNKKRDIDVFLDFLKEEKRTKPLILLAQEVKEAENIKITAMLNASKSEEVFKDWEIFLKEQSDFYQGKDYDKPIKKVVAYALRLQILRLQKSLALLNNECENLHFHNTRIQIKRLRYLLEIFIDMFAIKSLEKCRQRAKEIQEIFGDLQDRDIWLEILKDLEQNSKDSIEISSKLKTKIYKQMFKLRYKILDKKPKFMRNLGKISKNLKIYYM